MSSAQLADSTHLKALHYVENRYRRADELRAVASLDVVPGTRNDEARAGNPESLLYLDGPVQCFTSQPAFVRRMAFDAVLLDPLAP